MIEIKSNRTVTLDPSRIDAVSVSPTQSYTNLYVKFRNSDDVQEVGRFNIEEDAMFYYGRIVKAMEDAKKSMPPLSPDRR